jgi:hypothetical protein
MGALSLVRARRCAIEVHCDSFFVLRMQFAATDRAQGAARPLENLRASTKKTLTAIFITRTLES